MAQRVEIADLADAIARELETYRQDVTDGVKTSVRQAAKETAKEIKANAGADFDGTGEYAKGWTATVKFENSEDIRVSIHNKKKPQLTHLLEHGHAKVNGGRVEGHPHIAPAEQRAEKKLLKRVKVVVKGGA